MLDDIEQPPIHAVDEKVRVSSTRRSAADGEVCGAENLVAQVGGLGAFPARVAINDEVRHVRARPRVGGERLEHEPVKLRHAAAGENILAQRTCSVVAGKIEAESVLRREVFAAGNVAVNIERTVLLPSGTGLDPLGGDCDGGQLWCLQRAGVRRRTVERDEVAQLPHDADARDGEQRIRDTVAGLRGARHIRVHFQVHGMPRRPRRGPAGARRGLHSDLRREEIRLRVHVRREQVCLKSSRTERRRSGDIERRARRRNERAVRERGRTAIQRINERRSRRGTRHRSGKGGGEPTAIHAEMDVGDEAGNARGVCGTGRRRWQEAVCGGAQFCQLGNDKQFVAGHTFIQRLNGQHVGPLRKH